MSIPFISYVACCSHLGPITAGLIKFKRLSRPMQIMVFLVIAFFIVYVVEIVYSIYRMNNLEIDNFGQVMETAVICIVYISAIKVKKLRMVNSLLLGAYFVLMAIDMLFFHTPDQLDALGASVGKFTMLLSGMLYVYYDFKYDTEPIGQDPVFWVAVGSMLYNIGTIFITVFAYQIIAMGRENALMIWNIVFLLTIVTNCFYIKGFFCTRS